MNVKLYKADQAAVYDITEMVETVEWCGSLSSAARTLDISVVNAPYDANMKTLVRAAVGDFVGLEIDGTEFFYGRVLGAEKFSEHGTVTWNCIELLQHLLKSTGKYNFKNTTAEAITTQVCADVQFPIGALAQTGLNIKSMLCDGVALYDIIMQAYTKAYRISGKNYQCVMKDRKLEVTEKGLMVVNFSLSENMNITKTAFSESTESVVNRVKIYNEASQQVGEVSNAESIEKYGIFQTVYTQEDGIDPTTAAGNLLASPEQTLSVDAIGDLNCLSGRGITVTDQATGISGLYWIKSDKHTWGSGTHTMALELDFQNLMDTKESPEE